MVEEAPEVSYGFEAQLLTNEHKTEAGYDTDFVLIIQNTGDIADTFDIGVKSNDGGFTITIEEGYDSIVLGTDKRKPIIINVKTSESAQGMLYAYLEVRSRGDPSQTSDVKLNVNTDYVFGNQTSTGDSVNVHYAGILASNAKLFDSSMNYILDNYNYYHTGVSDSRNPPGGNGGRGDCSDSKYKNEQECTSNGETWTIPPLNANNIGCDAEGYPTSDCEGGRQMVKGFDNKMVDMYEGQTLSVRIPAIDAYGEQKDPNDPNSLGGEDLIFTIEMVSIN
jgi:FKBP-type peptidyl-prolyl cis-trans isomerase 2